LLVIHDTVNQLLDVFVADLGIGDGHGDALDFDLHWRTRCKVQIGGLFFGHDIEKIYQISHCTPRLLTALPRLIFRPLLPRRLMLPEPGDQGCHHSGIKLFAALFLQVLHSIIM